jgi:hypothetical protein
MEGCVCDEELAMTQIIITAASTGDLGYLLIGA